MLPIVAGDILGVGAAGYGLLATAQPIGALLVGLLLSLREEMKRQGLILLLSVALYGLATAIFGVSTIFVLSYLMFALTGAGDTISSIIRGTIRQLATPDSLRGQVVSANMLFFMTGPQLGELRAGILAALFGAPFAILRRWLGDCVARRLGCLAVSIDSPLQQFRGSEAQAAGAGQLTNGDR